MYTCLVYHDSTCVYFILFFFGIVFWSEKKSRALLSFVITQWYSVGRLCGNRFGKKIMVVVMPRVLPCMSMFGLESTLKPIITYIFYQYLFIKKIAMKQLARAFQAIVRGLLLVLQFSGSTVAMPVMENARTLADLPETERMDPLQIRRLYLSENRSTPVTADRCRALTTPERAMETAMHPNEMKYFKHVSVAPEPAVGWKSKMLCIAYTYEGDHTTKGIGMISTWMHRCDGAVLLSNKTDTALPSVDVPHIGPER